MREVGQHAAAVMVLVGWGIPMVRDDDRLRQIMLDIEAHDDPIYQYSLTGGSSDEERIHYYHMQLLVDAGYLEETGRHGGSFRMTMAGHDFLALTRVDARWEAVKGAARSIGGTTVRMMGDIAYALARDKLRAVGVMLD